ncbi:nep1/mra1 [Anaeramoeba flamelloides]|uniref:Nep1/mra1 n=1 Tax=Anaeramoeba flamelloides TaxID=1746091 RepID=A0AAV7ZHS7_9EUKA|nr:nep1/mra1 [Anaeramoeba flamelloides]KAJ6235554.1 nep1/mra1 [Anaeramoeba flamelloides]
MTTSMKRKRTRNKKNEKGVIVVLENASLETIKIDNRNELLNFDSHKKILAKKGEDISKARPDIVHLSLLALLDSPLNKSGKLRIYIHTQKNILIEVNPTIRLPRTFKRFAGLMVSLLNKRSIYVSESEEVLLRIINNPVTQYFPPKSKVYHCSYKSEKLVDLTDFIPIVQKNPTVYVIGAMPHGSLNIDWADETISVSEYSLSTQATCARLCFAYEKFFGIV